MDRDRALAIQRTALVEWLAVMAQSSEGARLLETGAPLPARSRRPRSARSRTRPPTRTPAPCSTATPSSSGFYADAGIEAWTVWVPEFDRAAIEGLEGAGHRFDGEPMGMVLELDRWEPPDLGDLEWDADGAMAEAGEVNDRAYGYGAGSGYARAMSREVAGYRIYRARVGGELACVAGAIEHTGGDLGIYFVATLPEHRGRGLPPG